MNFKGQYYKKLNKKLPLTLFYATELTNKCLPAKVVCTAKTTKRWTQNISFFSAMMKDMWLIRSEGGLGTAPCNRTLDTCFCWGVERWHSRSQNWLHPNLSRHNLDLPPTPHFDRNCFMHKESSEGLIRESDQERERGWSIVYFHRNIPGVDSYSLVQRAESLRNFPDSRHCVNSHQDPSLGQWRMTLIFTLPLWW